MPAVGGSIQEFNIGGKTYTVAFDADSQRKLGGFENEKQANGDGSARTIKTIVPWMIAGLTASIDDFNDDQEDLQAVADSNEDGPITITYASGAIYQASGTLVDELNFGNQGTTASVTLSGPGKLTRQ